MKKYLLMSSAGALRVNKYCTAEEKHIKTAISDYLPTGEIKFKISHLSIHIHTYLSSDSRASGPGFEALSGHIRSFPLPTEVSY